MDTKKLLWLLSGVVLIVIFGAMLQRNDGSTPDPEAFPSVPAQERAAAVGRRPITEQPPPRPAVQPREREWKVLFTRPPDGKGGVVRSTAVDVFFNVPVERDVVEWAFAISPSIPGNISWPRPDHLVFEPQEPLLPATKYTVSLNSTNGSRGEEAYTLHGARTSFTTGEARTYDKDIRPLVSAYCQSCHGPPGRLPLFPWEPIRLSGDTSSPAARARAVSTHSSRTGSTSSEWPARIIPPTTSLPSSRTGLTRIRRRNTKRATPLIDAGRRARTSTPSCRFKRYSLIPPGVAASFNCTSNGLVASPT